MKVIFFSEGKIYGKVPRTFENVEQSLFSLSQLDGLVTY